MTGHAVIGHAGPGLFCSSNSREEFNYIYLFYFIHLRHIYQSYFLLPLMLLQLQAVNFLTRLSFLLSKR